MSRSLRYYTFSYEWGLLVRFWCEACATSPNEELASERGTRVVVARPTYCRLGRTTFVHLLVHHSHVVRLATCLADARTPLVPVSLAWRMSKIGAVRVVLGGRARPPLTSPSKLLVGEHRSVSAQRFSITTSPAEEHTYSRRRYTDHISFFLALVSATNNCTHLAGLQIYYPGACARRTTPPAQQLSSTPTDPANIEPSIRVLA